MTANLLAKLDRLQLWHAQLTDKSWLQPLEPTRWILIFIVLVGIIAASMNSYVRYVQYEVWEQNEQLFYLDDGTPLFTTSDAPYFLGLAQAIKRDGNFQTFNEKRQFSLMREAQSKERSLDSSLRGAPLLSVVISILAEDSTVKSLSLSANSLLIVTAILTTFMVVLSFGAAGYWLEGSVAAAGGGLSSAYLMRSGAGRIDTDQLNLGFFYLMIAMIIWAARAKTQRASIILAALAGTVYWFFDWWYAKPIFGWCFFISFLCLSFVCRRKIKILFLQSFLFLGLSGLPFIGLDISGDSAYFLDKLSIEGLVFPNTFDTITEVRKLQISQILENISGSVWLGIVSLVGLGLWAIRHPGLAIVFGPAAVFALLNFVIGSRAIFYSAPIFWFGFAWLLLTAARYAVSATKTTKMTNSVVSMVTIIAFLSVWFLSPTKYVQGPTFEKSIIGHFQKLDTVLPKSGLVIASWWDYGYMSMLMNGRPTFHDGGSQLTPTTYLIANNLIQKNQEQAATELDIMGASGYQGVIKNRLGKFEKINVPPIDVYLVLTKDMRRWFTSISQIGAFDIETGKSYQFDGVKDDFQLGYNELKCKPTSSNQEFLCDGNKLNLNTGQLGNTTVLEGIVVTKNGQQISGRNFPKGNIPFVLHSEVGVKESRNMLIHRDLYFSVFHQLFYLNRAAPKYFKLVYDGFPDMRVFKVM